MICKTPETINKINTVTQKLKSYLSGANKYKKSERMLIIKKYINFIFVLKLKYFYSL